MKAIFRLEKRSLVRWIPWLILAFALAIRVHGMGWGFPEVYEGDAPHMVSTAVYFGSGDLNPHDFKYPTLWMYVLFFAYGCLYVLGRLAHVFHSVEDFGVFFIWKTWVFYLIGRILAVAASVGGIAFVMRTAREHISDWASAAAGLLLAVCAYNVNGAGMAKMDMLHFGLLCAAWWSAGRLVQDGWRRDYVLTALFLGLAAGTHYGAVFFWPVLLIAHLLHGWTHQLSWRAVCFSPDFWLGVVLIPVTFVATTPFLIFDFKEFIADFSDAVSYAAVGITAHQPRGWHDTFNALYRIGGWSMMAAMAAGTLYALTDFPYGALWIIPSLYCIVFAGVLSETAGSLRYLYGLLPAMTLVAVNVLDHLRRKPWGRWLASVLLAAVFLPNLVATVQQQNEQALPEDTRTVARAWIEQHIPAGRVFLLDEPHTSPNLLMEKKEVQKMYEKTRQSGHRRAEYYRLMMDRHPGGGYRIYRLLRTKEELATFPRQTVISQAGYPMLDAVGGVGALRKAGVQYVVTSNIGATPNAVHIRLKRYFDDLEHKAREIQVFEPIPGRRRGPTLRIYAL